METIINTGIFFIYVIAAWFFYCLAAGTILLGYLLIVVDKQTDKETIKILSVCAMVTIIFLVFKLCLGDVKDNL